MARTHRTGSVSAEQAQPPRQSQATPEELAKVVVSTGPSLPALGSSKFTFKTEKHPKNYSEVHTWTCWLPQSWLPQ